MNKKLFPKLCVPEWFDETIDYEIGLKGFFDHATVELENGEIYKVSFFDPIRLGQSVEDSIELKSFFAEPGLIVLPEISYKTMEGVLIQLQNSGFFQHLKPITEELKQHVKHMDNFTFFMEFMGGTYISQIDAPSIIEAPNIWVNQIDYKQISGAKINFRNKLLESLDLPPVALEDLHNIWSLIGLVGDNLALIHFTKTSE